MHVILVFTYGISIKEWDNLGILSREVEIYKKMNKEHNVRFTFLTFGDHEDEKYSHLINDLTIIPIYKYINKSKTSIFNFFKTLIGVKKLIKFIEKPTVIKTNQLNGSWVAMMLKLYTKSPLYIRTGYNLFEFSVKDKKNIFKKIFYYLLTQISLIYSNNYSVTSNADKLFLEKYFYTKNISVIPNWVADVKFNDFNNRYKNKVLSVGRLEPQKNFFSLIKSLSNSNIELDLVGEGSEKKPLRKYADSLNVKLNLLGRLEHSVLNQHYLKYRIFILPSGFEGNPKVVLEAISRGTLIIAKKNKNIAEVITNGLNGVLYENENEIIDKITYFLENESELKKLVNKAYELIVEINSIEKIVESELNIFNQK